MAFNYAKSEATARRLIAKFGQEAKLLKYPASTGPSYDPTQGAVSEVAIRLVDLNIAKRTKPENPQDGALVAGFKRTVYISTEEIDAEFVVDRKDRIQIGTGKPLEIEEVRPLSPAGLLVMWEVDLVVQ